MDLNEYLRLLRRRWRILAACVLVAGVAAWVTTPAEPTNDNVTYTATHQLLRDSSSAAPPALATVSLLAKTGEVPVRAAERLDYDGEPAVLAAGITLEPDEQLGTLELTAKGTSRAEATRRANVFAEELLAYLGEEATGSQQEQIARINEQLTTLQAEIDDLDRQLEAAEEAEGSTGTLQATRDSKLRQYGAALDQQQQIVNQPPPSAGYISLQEALPELASLESGGFSAPSSRPARTAIAIAVGLLLGLGVVLVVERLDTRIHDVDVAATTYQLPVIAEVPVTALKRSDRRIVSRLEPMSAFAEAHRKLRSALVLSPTTRLGIDPPGQPSGTEAPQVILVTSPAPGDGKTTTTANLAAVMAEAGRSVLVLGCDFRRPEIHAYFGMLPSPGIADVIRKDGAIRFEDVIRPTSIPGVSVAPSGSKLRSFGDVAAAGRQLVEAARQYADVVIIDTAPLLATNDASELIPACDAVVIVSRIGKTTADGARRTRFLLERLGAPVAGVVAVGVAEATANYAKYYADEGGRTRRGPHRATREPSPIDDTTERTGEGTTGAPVVRPQPTSSPVGDAPAERPQMTNGSEDFERSQVPVTLSEGDGPDPRT